MPSACRSNSATQSLDTGAEFTVDGPKSDPKTALAFADALLQLLASFVEPVIPTALHAKCAEMTSRDEAFEVPASCARSYTRVPPH